MACAIHICCVAAIKCRFIRFIVYVSRALDNVPDHLERLGLLWSVYGAAGADPPLLRYWLSGQASPKERSEHSDRHGRGALPVKPAHPVRSILYQEALLGTRKQRSLQWFFRSGQENDRSQMRRAGHRLHFQSVALGDIRRIHRRSRRASRIPVNWLRGARSPGVPARYTRRLTLERYIFCERSRP